MAIVYQDLWKKLGMDVRVETIDVLVMKAILEWDLKE